ncbi:hypothetical protein Q6249_28685, partial [Klebsiella pneumoniae]
MNSLLLSGIITSLVVVLNPGINVAKHAVAQEPFLFQHACGVAGIRPGAYCEPKMTSVGSQ